MGYYSHDEGTWIFSNQFPASERRFKVCGYVEKSKPVDLLLTITEPNDKNVYLYQSQYFYKMDTSGEFCEMLYLSGEIVPDKYTLWVMDARRTAAQLEIEFIEK